MQIFPRMEDIVVGVLRTGNRVSKRGGKLLSVTDTKALIQIAPLAIREVLYSFDYRKEWAWTLAYTDKIFNLSLALSVRRGSSASGNSSNEAFSHTLGRSGQCRGSGGQLQNHWIRHSGEEWVKSKNDSQSYLYITNRITASFRQRLPEMGQNGAVRHSGVPAYSRTQSDCPRARKSYDLFCE